MVTKGVKQTAEHIKSRSLALKGRKAPSGAFKMGHIGFKAFLGKKFSEEHKKKISVGHIGILTKEKNPAWKGGVAPINNLIRSSIESKLWIQSVFARDGYTCQKTGLRGGKLTAHHIHNFSSYPQLRFAIDNGITFSIESHKEFHRIYGKKDNTMAQIEEFLAKRCL